MKIIWWLAGGAVLVGGGVAVAVALAPVEAPWWEKMWRVPTPDAPVPEGFQLPQAVTPEGLLVRPETGPLGVVRPPPPRMPTPDAEPVPEPPPREPTPGPFDNVWEGYATPGEAISAFHAKYSLKTGPFSYTQAQDAIREYRNWALARVEELPGVTIAGFTDRQRRRAVCDRHKGLPSYALAAMMRRWAWDAGLIPTYHRSEMPPSVGAVWTSWHKPPKSEVIEYESRAAFRDSFCPD